MITDRRALSSAARSLRPAESNPTCEYVCGRWERNPDCTPFDPSLAQQVHHCIAKCEAALPCYDERGCSAELDRYVACSDEEACNFGCNDAWRDLRACVAASGEVCPEWFGAMSPYTAEDL
ncbi:MAG: hypothetical protein J0L92_32170 [Deltaproteobacteria bacterium]|nr:hypothetical protein [Deltaproteobacteria bacterium]